jgi:hypothetical protein
MEIWKPITYENLKFIYMVSNLGRVKNTKTSRLLTPKPTNGYLIVVLTYHGKIYKDHAIHRIVAHTFLENLYGKEYVNHINGDKTDNSIINLEWVTQKENVIHSVNSGLITPRTRSVKQLTLDDIFIRTFASTTEASLSINKSRSAVEKACCGDNPTAGGFKWQYETANDLCDLTNAKFIIGYPRYKITTYGDVYSMLYKRAMKLQTNQNGYKLIQFSVNKAKKNYYIHQLVAKHFIPNPTNKPFVNHINGNKTDNKVSNLEWVTQSENTQHYYDELRTIQS